MRKLTKKMKVKDENGVSRITQSSLRGGMQDRLHRQEIIRHAEAIKKHKRDKSSRDMNKSFGVQSVGVEISREMADFKEPVFRRIRSKRGFFDE